MKNVFHIITHFEMGGAEIVAANICKSESKQFKYHILAVVNSKSEYSQMFMKTIEDVGVVCHSSRCSNNKLGIVFFPFWFVFLVMRYRPVIVHTHTEVPDLSLYIFNKIFGWIPVWKKVKIVRTIHNTKLWSDWESIGKRVERYFQKKKANVSISQSVRQRYREQFGEDTPIIYNGVETKKQQAFPNIVKGRINIIFAGRFEEQKGISQVASILKRFRNDKRFFFHIVGSGSMQKDIEAAISEMENGRLYDKIYSLSSYLASFDFVLMPSNFEGFGLVSVEASMCKTPTLINATCPGLNETLPKDWPLSVKDNNTNDWYSLIDTLDKFDAKQLGTSAYNFVSTRFAVVRMQKEYEKLYNQ